MKPQNKYSIYGINTCNSCRYDISLKSKGKIRKFIKYVLITDTVTKEVFKYVNKSKCVISKNLVKRYANTGKLVYPYRNSKHKNPLLVEIYNT